MIFKGKKASIQDIVLMIGVVMFFAIIILISFKVTSEFNTHVLSDTNIPTEAKVATASLTQVYPGVMDNMFLLFTIGMGLVAIILASLVRVHPVFMIFFFIALVFLIFISGTVSNVYSEMASNAQLSTEANQLTMTSHIMTYLPFIVGIIGIVLMIVMYKTWSNAQDGF